MDEIKLQPIGTIESGNAGATLVLAPPFRAGLKGISGFSHVQVLWWMDKCDNPRDRGTLAPREDFRCSHHDHGEGHSCGDRHEEGGHRCGGHCHG